MPAGAPRTDPAPLPERQVPPRLREKISRPCGTYAIPRLARCQGAQRVTSAPSKVTLPEATESSPIMQRRSVVLLTPLRPSSAVHDPRGTSTSMPRSVWLPP